MYMLKNNEKKESGLHVPESRCGRKVDQGNKRCCCWKPLWDKQINMICFTEKNEGKTKGGVQVSGIMYKNRMCKSA
jgi:hypothetical protein